MGAERRGGMGVAGRLAPCCRPCPSSLHGPVHLARHRPPNPPGLDGGGGVGGGSGRGVGGSGGGG
ncbi:hypothetical protein I4F81_010604 [Pyropia yezoensis]|uniref:Uncharacterized protein n=1 Tax=Pyropia yezoensis TaxID=2788 RepID=A0ACC3CD63_PYRYE|nr:hypothetical protein I4F81_010604 [Neopyropia yezoensis]